MPWWETEQGEFQENGIFGERRFKRTQAQQSQEQKVVVNQVNAVNQSQRIGKPKPFIKPIAPTEELASYGAAIRTIAKPFTTEGRIEATKNKIKLLKSQSRLKRLQEKAKELEPKEIQARQRAREAGLEGMKVYEPSAVQKIVGFFKPKIYR